MTKTRGGLNADELEQKENKGDVMYTAVLIVVPGVVISWLLTHRSIFY